MSEPKGFFTYFHHAPILDALSDEQAGQLYKALLYYGSTGEEPYWDDPALEIAFTAFRIEIDYNFERYREICAKRSDAAKEREARKRAKRQELNDDD